MKEIVADHAVDYLNQASDRRSDYTPQLHSDY